MRQRCTEKTPRRGGGRVTAEAEAGATGPQARNGAGTRAPRSEGGPSPRAFLGGRALPTL